MAFASPDMQFTPGRWPAVADFVWDAAARLIDVAATLRRAVSRVTGSLIATVGAFQRADAKIARPTAVVQVTLQPMTLTEQWSKISSILVSAVDGARVATDMQCAATQQLDLAQYGLITLVDELSAVMALPGRRSRTATVHAFGGAPLGSNVHALAA